MRLTFEDGAGEIVSLQLQIQGPQVTLSRQVVERWDADGLTPRLFRRALGGKKMKKGVGEPGSIGWYGTLMKRM